MVDKQKFPQIPSTVWWGVRSILQKTPRAAVDERMLGVHLGVQEAAARQYIAELKNVGLLDDDCRATPLAAKWRLDDTYSEAVEDLVQKNYPEGLVHLSHPRDGDRQRVVAWFEREGLGRGAAGNKAATYLLMGSELPSDAPTKSSTGNGKSGNAKPAVKKAARVRASQSSSSGGEEVIATPAARSVPSGGQVAMPLNVNVQIHISADAGADQINAIFDAMRRYLGSGTDA